MDIRIFLNLYIYPTYAIFIDENNNRSKGGMESHSFVILLMHSVEPWNHNMKETHYSTTLYSRSKVRSFEANLCPLGYSRPLPHHGFKRNIRGHSLDPHYEISKFKFKCKLQPTRINNPLPHL